MSNLSSVITDINKKFKVELAHFGNNGYKERKLLKFSTPALNYPFFGGIPKGILLEFIGAEGAGKTSTAMILTSSAQKQFNDEYDEEFKFLEEKKTKTKTETERLAFLRENGAQRVLWIDAENTFDNDYAEKLGIDVENLLFIKPQEQSAEDIFDMIIAIVESGAIGLVVLDSIGALYSNAEQEKAIGEATYGGIAKPLTRFSKKMVGICGKYQCTLVGINQLRDKIGSTYGGTTGVGGRGWRHYCSIRMEFKKGKFLDNNYKELTSHPELAYGNMVECEVVKNKVCPPIRRMLKYTLNYEKGLDRENDIFEMGVGLHIIEKSGAWYGLMNDDGTDYMVDDEGTQIRFQGKNKFIGYLSENNNITDKILNEINKYIEKR